MPTKEAAVRLTLNEGAFLGGMRRVGDAVKMVKREASTISAGVGAAAWKKGGDAVQSMRKEIGMATNMALKFGTAMVSVAALKSTFETKERFENLAFRIRSATDEAVDWKDVQLDVSKVAKETGQKTLMMADVYDRLYDDLGPAARQSGMLNAALKAVGMQSTATGGDMTRLSTIAVTLAEKFGIQKDQIGNELAAIEELGNRGGITVDELAEKLGLIGGAARLAGMTGSKGLHEIVGWLNLGKDGFGNMRKAASGVSEFMAGFETKQKALSKKFGKDIKFVDEHGEKRAFTAVLADILAKGPKARAALLEGLSTAQAQAVSALTDSFDKAYKQAKDAKKTDKQATEAGVEAYRRALDEAGKTHLTAADIQDQAADRMKSVEHSMRRIKMSTMGAFSSREIVDAFEQGASAMADKMPSLAKSLTPALVFGVQHPMLGIAGLFAAKTAAALASGGAEKLGLNISKAMWNSGAWKNIGSGIGTSFVGFIAAAGLGVTIGKQFSDYLGERQTSSMNETAMATAVSGRAGTLEQKRAALAGEKEKLKAGEGGLGETWQEKLMSGFTIARRSLGTMSDEDWEVAQSSLRKRREAHKTNIDDLERQIARMEAEARTPPPVAGTGGAAGVVPGKAAASPSGDRIGKAAGEHIEKSLRAQPLLVRIMNHPLNGGAGSGGDFPPPVPGYGPR